MLRALILIFIPVLIPPLSYYLWRLWRKRKGKGDPIDEKATPWGPLAAFSGALFVLGLVLFFLMDQRAEKGQIYIPPKFEDGKLVPGHHVPAGTVEPDKVFD